MKPNTEEYKNVLPQIGFLVLERALEKYILQKLALRKGLYNFYSIKNLYRLKLPNRGNSPKEKGLSKHLKISSISLVVKTYKLKHDTFSTFQ